MWHRFRMPQLPQSLVLNSEQVRLREWTLDDAPALETICGDPEITPFTSIPSSYSLPAARAWVRLQSQRRAEGASLALAIESKQESAVVGNVNLVRFSDDRRSAALGYWTLPEARRKGYARSAVLTLSDWAFTKFAIETIEMSIARHNLASMAVARAVGAREVGTRFAQPLGLKAPIELQLFTLESSQLLGG